MGLSTSDNYLTIIHDLPKRPGPLGHINQYRPVLELVQQLIGSTTCPSAQVPWRASSSTARCWRWWNN
ncbi:MAG: hypothetical protein HYW07_24310 [Candidatus Latescibacteria bacterium]|nr:hypothetical protein [Candidatus Latescibacterota bacterium]